MTIAEICSQPVAQFAADDAHLHLWTTSVFLREAFEVIEAWGLKYACSSFVWVKPHMGLGNFFRSAHELILPGIRGKLPFLDKGQRSWMEAKRTSHSRKPEAVREIIEKVSPGPYPRFLKKWIRGEHADFFPYRVRVRLTIDRADPSATIAASEALLSKSKARRGWGYTVHREQVRVRDFGSNPVPKAITIDTLDDLLRLAGKNDDFAATQRVVESIMMDRVTMTRHETYLVQGNDFTPTAPTNLTTSETAAFDFCSRNNCRLEQEKIQQPYVNQTLSELAATGSDYRVP